MGEVPQTITHLRSLMSSKLNRRDFIARSATAGVTVAASAGMIAAAQAADLPPGKEKQAPLQHAVVAGSKNSLPTGKIGKLTLSRLISGGNLISGWAHSRDLQYVPSLMRA